MSIGSIIYIYIYENDHILKNISFFGDGIEKENNSSGIEEKCGHHIYKE